MYCSETAPEEAGTKKTSTREQCHARLKNYPTKHSVRFLYFLISFFFSLTFVNSRFMISIESLKTTNFFIILVNIYLETQNMCKKIMSNNVM